MLEALKQFDLELFTLINQKLRCSFLDIWMPIITDVDNWIWAIVLGWLGLFIFGGSRGRKACIVLVVAVLVFDNLSSYILKPLFGRLRPGHVIDTAYLIGAKGKSFSFPSNHATNSFVFAGVMSWYYPKIIPIWFLFAFAVAYSRIYVGVHYPFDVIAGALLGITGASFIVLCEKFITKEITKKLKK